MKYKKKSEFNFHVDYKQTQNCPCVRRSCAGFMFKTLVCYEDYGDIIEEWECYSCHKTRRIGIVQRNNKPVNKGSRDDKSRRFSGKSRQDSKERKRRDWNQNKQNGSDGNSRRVSRSKGSPPKDS